MKKISLILLAFELTQAPSCQKATSLKVDELMNAYCKVNKFNGTVLVSQKGKVLFAKGYGIKNAQTSAFNDTNSIFQIYSITKTFTSAVIFKLIELKKLSLTDKLSKFYPSFPKGDSITIEHLLTHTSGIYDYTQGNNMPDQTEESFVTFLKTKPLDFNPGTNWNYSNSGYYFLGYIIQKITGTTYEDAVTKYVFEPLQMKQSGFAFKNLRNENKTVGYEIFTHKAKKEAVVYDPPGPFATGGIYSTVGDLNKYYNGLKEFKILAKESFEKATTALKNNYGYGWMINSFEGRKTISHSGGAAGFRSNFLCIPSDDICIILLNNNENANTDLITKNILNIIYDRPYKIPFEISVDKNVLKTYEGSFSINPGFTMYVTIENEKLAVIASGQGKTTPIAERENYFYSEDANGYLEFEKTKSGNCNTLIIHQGGQHIEAKRIYPSWGLLGSAVPNGWESKDDIKFIEDPNKKGLWILESIELSTGEIKFRFNNDWTINFGDNNNDGNLDMYGGNIKVNKGVYNITLDLTNSDKPTFSIKR